MKRPPGRAHIAVPIAAGRPQKDAPYFVYIVQCRDGTYYTGISPNVDRRVAAHNTGRGAKYTSSRYPVRLLWTKRCEGRGDALREEMRIKRFTREEKTRFMEKSRPEKGSLRQELA